MDGATVPAHSAWVVLSSAHWHVRSRPEVPIVLLCTDAACRRAIVHNGVAHHVPVCATLDAAVAAVSSSEPPRRRRARAEFPDDYTSLWRSRDPVARSRTAWSHADLIPVGQVVVTALVENVLQHTDSRPSGRLETDGPTIMVAVEDGGAAPASVRELPGGDDAPSGLEIVSMLCRARGNAPTPTGKTVWAVIGPENRL